MEQVHGDGANERKKVGDVDVIVKVITAAMVPAGCVFVK